MTVVVIGSINVDLQFRLARFPRPGETVLAEQSNQGLGGKGANQALAAARMGAEVTMLGAVGRDGVGERLVSTLAIDRVDVSAVRYIPDVPTGAASIYLAGAENMIVVAAGANTRYDGSVPQNVIAQRDLTVLVQLETNLPAIRSALNALAHAKCVILNAAPAVNGGDRLFPLADILVRNETELFTCLFPGEIVSRWPLPLARAAA